MEHRFENLRVANRIKKFAFILRNDKFRYHVCNIQFGLYSEPHNSNPYVWLIKS
jgi:hypothetical protein